MDIEKINAALVSLAGGAAEPSSGPLRRIGSIELGNGAEINAFDPESQRLFVVSGEAELQIVDLSDPSQPLALESVDLSTFGSGANSVAVSNGVIAIAVEAEISTNAGQVVFFNVSGEVLATVRVGSLPDQLTFTPDGTKVLVANEGEPNDGINAEGSISIIDVSGGVGALTQDNVTSVSFDAFNGREVELRNRGVRIFPGERVSQDVEPEYISVSPDGATAFVTLQENNALAVVDLDSKTVQDILPLGVKDFSRGPAELTQLTLEDLPLLGTTAGGDEIALGGFSGLWFGEGNTLDASDEDGGINLQNQPVFGLYQPDAIASYQANGQTYYITANEGDARDEAQRISELVLDPDAFPDAATLQTDKNLGRLEVSTIDGDLDGDGDFDQLFSYGGRSFSIWDAFGNQVFDSSDQIARITAELSPELFNADDGDPAEVDTRSDNSGAEPEAVTVGQVGDRTYAFIGLERAGGGVLVYDVTDPTAPVFQQYVRDDQDIAPEGLTFVSADGSPNGQNLLVVTNEVSSTVAVYAFIPEVSLFNIQGEGHLSGFDGQTVTTTGIVTAVDFNGFYLQDAIGDGNDSTSDGIFVFTGDTPTFGVGDELQLTGDVSEFIPGGANTGNLSSTQLSNLSSTTVLSRNNDLPEAVVIGVSGRLPASKVVIGEDELPTNLQSELSEFDPENDAIDFFESLEGQQVTVEDSVAISPTQVFNEFSAEAFTLPNQGAGASPDGALTSRGTLNLFSGPDNTGDQNPERVQIQFDPDLLPEGVDTPALNVGDQLGDVTGVVGYSFGNFEVNVTEEFTVTPSNLEREVTALAGTDRQLTIANYNVLNLDPNDEDGSEDVANGQFERLAAQIVNHLQSPDVIALQEIQDNSGSEDDGTTAADVTLQTLVDAIASAGGPTYEFRTLDPKDGAFGGEPGGNIRNAFLFNPERTQINEDSLQLLTPEILTELGAANPNAFEGSRSPLVAAFEFNGETVQVVNNHFSSRFGSTPIFGAEQPFIQAGEEEREAQAQAINNYVDAQLASQPDANIIVAGDLNTFDFTNDLTDILPGAGDEQVLTSLVPQAVATDDAYTFIFDGNAQVLDHQFATDALAAGAEFDIVHVNNDFARDDQGLFEEQASDHEPVIGRYTVGSENGGNTFSLEILHASDQEAGIPALDDAPNFSAVLNALKAEDLGNDSEPDNTLTLSSGDALIPGLFYDASAETLGAPGRADVLIQNELGFQAVALGNHEFDNGTEVLAGLIAAAEDDPATPDVDESFAGTAFPYLSANLDFSTDGNLAPLVVGDAQTPQGNSLAASTILDVNGEQIGVVGATTPTLSSISSSGDVTVLPVDFEGVPTPEQLDALAAEIQVDVDALLDTNPDLDKVVLLSHLQQISIEQELATRLRGVDVIMAGGSNTLLADESDRLRTGDTVQGEYPIFTTDADGNPTAVVNTDGNYQYVGRLVVDFDENGHVVPESYDPKVSGAYATDAQGIADLNAEALVDPEIQAILEDLREVIVEKESNVFGLSEVYLEGRRDSVRTEETNLGNLTADANLSLAQEFDDSVVLSLKNGGGIRNDIGQVIVEGTGTSQELPNEAVTDADGNIVKPEGGISETDIANSLSFNNSLTLLTLTADQLIEVVEHGVAATEEGDTPGQFPQIAGLQFSFDPDAAMGDRVQSLSITDAEGNDIDTLVQDGEPIGDPSRTFRIVTLGFLADGGDGYPFPTGPAVNRVDLPSVLTETGIATFADPGTEQDALAEYLAANFPADNEATTPTFSEAETEPVEDTRIQNLNFRDDTVINAPQFNEITGTNRGDVLSGTAEADAIEGLNGNDVIQGLLADDLLEGDNGSDNIQGGAGHDTILGGNGRDVLSGRHGDDSVEGGNGGDFLSGGRGSDQLSGGADRDQVVGDLGEDTLIGGAGRDLLSGGRGADLFVLEVGQDQDFIRDYQIGQDSIGLSDGLTVDQLGVSTRNGNTFILFEAENQRLAVLSNVTVELEDLTFQTFSSIV